MIYEIIVPALIGGAATALIFLGDKYLHQRMKKAWVYVLWAIFMIYLAFYAFPVHGDNYSRHPLDYEFTGHKCRKETFVIKTKKQQYLEIAENHRRMGRKAYEDADSMCLFIPDWNDKHNAQFLFRTCISQIVGGSPQSFAISLLINGLAEYGICIWDRYNEMKQLLDDSAFHYSERDKYLAMAAKYPE